MDHTDTKLVDQRHLSDDDDLDMELDALPDWLVGGGTPPDLQTPLVDGPDGGAAVGIEPEMRERPLPGPGDHPSGTEDPARPAAVDGA